jgi:ankyrin repeat protein
MAAHVDLLAPNHLGQTAVHAAVMRGSVTVLEKLAEIGAPLDTPDRFGRTPMQLACLHRWPVVCLTLTAMNGHIQQFVVLHPPCRITI